jgi:hypothetical protein
VAYNFSDVSYIFSDSDSDSKGSVTRRRQNKTVHLFSVIVKMIVLMITLMTIMILKI